MADAEALQKLECSICKTAFAQRDWGGFCRDCGFSLPDREDSLVLEEVSRLQGVVSDLPMSTWFSLGKGGTIYGGIFLGLTALLFLNPGPSAIIPGTPINLANLVWLATGGPLFGILAFAASDLELPE